MEDLVVRERTGERRKRELVCVLWHVKSESTRTSKEKDESKKGYRRANRNSGLGDADQDIADAESITFGGWVWTAQKYMHPGIVESDVMGGERGVHNTPARIRHSGPKKK